MLGCKAQVTRRRSTLDAVIVCWKRMCANGDEMSARPKFESRLQVWLPTEIADAYEALANGGLLSVSDHVRLALVNHLRAVGALPAPRPAANGKDHLQQEAAA